MIICALPVSFICCVLSTAHYTDNVYDTNGAFAYEFLHFNCFNSDEPVFR